MNAPTSTVMAPPAPKTLADMRLPIVMMRDILIKTVFRKNLDLVSELSKAVCLPIPVVQELVDMCRSQRLMEATGTLSTDGGNEMGYQLTDGGKARALDALAQSEYFGPMPVPLDVYKEQVKRQSVRNMQITRDQLSGAMGHLILPDELLGNLGPAVSAGRSILMYGPPGNGKSSISNGIRDALGDQVYVPRAIEYASQVITVFDPIVHNEIAEAAQDPTSLRRITRFDARYVCCERPSVITGGELSLDMLDLVYNPSAKTYQAPLQLKSTGGIFIVDDLGRQKSPRRASSTAGLSPWRKARISSPCNQVRNSKSPSTHWSSSRPTSTRTRFSTPRPCAVFSSKSKLMVQIRRTSSRSLRWLRKNAKCHWTRQR